MKKLLFLLLVIANFASAAQTNLFDSIKINTGLQFVPGAGAGLILGSDASGNASWVTVGSVGGGNWFSNSNNTQIAGVTNIFNGGNTFSNLTVRGISYTEGQATFNSAVLFSNNVAILQNLTVVGAQTNFGSVLLNVNLNVNGNTTLGNASSDTLTISGTSISMPNGGIINGLFSFPTLITDTVTNSANFRQVGLASFNSNIVMAISKTIGTAQNTIVLQNLVNGNINLVPGNADVAVSFETGGGTPFGWIASTNVFFQNLTANNANYFNILDMAGISRFNVNTLTKAVTVNASLTVNSNFTSLARNSLGAGATSFATTVYTNAVLGFPTVLAAGATEVATFPLTGAVAGDPVVAGYPPSLPGDSVWQMWCTNANLIIVRRTATVATVPYTNTFAARQFVQ